MAYGHYFPLSLRQLKGVATSWLGDESAWASPRPLRGNVGLRPPSAEGLDLGQKYLASEYAIYFYL